MILFKSHGLGNDYLVLHKHDRALTADDARWLCHRHRGVGGDGVLEPLPGQGADYGVRIWNPDGSIAEKSGNGLRVFARYLVDHRDAPRRHTISVEGAVVHCEVDEEGVTVELGTATFDPAAIPCTVPLKKTISPVRGALLELTAVGVGNPHCVVFFPERTDLDGLPWRIWGAALEVDPRFPNRTNVQFARILSRSEIELRIWERGAGETSASGSSSCAVAAAAVMLGLTDRDLTLIMPGGELSVKVGEDWSLTLRGPVEEVARIEVSR